MKKQNIPVVNLAWFHDPNKKSDFIEAVGRAFTDIGFLAVENHGIDASLIKEAYELSESFFLLPLKNARTLR